VSPCSLVREERTKVAAHSLKTVRPYLLTLVAERIAKKL